MKNFERITEFDFALNRDTVFHLIDLYPGNSVYDDILEEYYEIEKEAKLLIKPQAFVKFGTISDETAEHIGGDLVVETPVVYVLITLGEEIAELCSRYFQKGDYLLGMLINAIADAYLFQMEDTLKELLKERCIARHLGISKRMDAPSDMPMFVQKDILDEIKAEEEIDIGVTAGYMFTTVKTMGYILVLTEDEQAVYAGHNCNTCSAKNCRMRKEFYQNSLEEI